MKRPNGEKIFTRASTLEEVAEYVGCTIRFLYEEIKSGLLNARRISSGMIRIEPADLRKWLEQSQTNPPE